MGRESFKFDSTKLNQEIDGLSKSEVREPKEKSGRSRLEKIAGAFLEKVGGIDRVRERMYEPALRAFFSLENLYQNQKSTKGERVDPHMLQHFLEQAEEARETLEDHKRFFKQFHPETIEGIDATIFSLNEAIGELKKEYPGEVG